MSEKPEVIELQAFVEVSASVRDFRNRGNIQRRLASRLCDEMVTREVIEFADIIADDEIDGTDIYRARVRAVAPNAKAWLVERQADVAKQVADRAIALIRQWGSDYGDAHVSKDRAVNAIKQALGERGGHD